jgi:hypothetical protein
MEFLRKRSSIIDSIIASAKKVSFHVSFLSGEVKKEILIIIPQIAEEIIIIRKICIWLLKVNFLCKKSTGARSNISVSLRSRKT